jgi:hypothetical protein
MRVRTAALVCLLAGAAALSACGTEASDGAPPQKRPAASHATAHVLLEDPPQAPELVVHAATAVVLTQEGSRCWHSTTVGSCVDVAATEPKKLPVLTGAGPATFDFPVAGWTFTATITDFPDVPHAKHSEALEVEQPVPGRFVISPAIDTGDYQVALFGTGPQGDYTASFRWQLPVASGQVAASCVGPFLDDDYPNGRPSGPVASVRPGQTIELHGFFYTRTCNDTGQDRPLVPLRDVRLTVTFPGGQTTELGPFTPAGEMMGFAATIQVPPCADSGIATVSDDRDPPATYEFRIRR